MIGLFGPFIEGQKKKEKMVEMVKRGDFWILVSGVVLFLIFIFTEQSGIFGSLVYETSQDFVLSCDGCYRNFVPKATVFNFTIKNTNLPIIVEFPTAIELIDIGTAFLLGINDTNFRLLFNEDNSYAVLGSSDETGDYYINYFVQNKTKKLKVMVYDRKTYVIPEPSVITNKTEPVTQPSKHAEKYQIDIRDKFGNKIGSYLIVNDSVMISDSSTFSIGEGKPSFVRFKNLIDNVVSVKFDFIDDPAISTKVVAVMDDLTFESATIQLLAFDRVSSIVYCPNFDFDRFVCPKWEFSGLKFITEDGIIKFNANHFSAYAGSSSSPLFGVTYVINQTEGYYSDEFDDTNGTAVIRNATIDNSYAFLLKDLKSSQVIEKWNTTWALHSYGDMPSEVVTDSKDNIIVVGYGEYGSTSNDEYVIVKFNKSGSELWHRRIALPSSVDQAEDVAIDSNDNIISVGCYACGSSTSGNWTIFKHDENGTQLWNITFFMNGTRASGVDVDSSDNIYVGGQVLEPDGTDSDVQIRKYNSTGSLLWVRTNSPGEYNDNIGDLAVDSNNNVVAAGGTWTSASNKDTLIIKYDTNGNSLWNWTYNFNPGDCDEFYSLAVDSKNNIIAVGSTENDVWLIVKLNASGTLLWNKTYDPPPSGSYEYAEGVAVDSKDNIIVTGSKLDVRYSIRMGVSNFTVLR